MQDLIKELDNMSRNNPLFSYKLSLLEREVSDQSILEKYNTKRVSDSKYVVLLNGYFEKRSKPFLELNVSLYLESFLSMCSLYDKVTSCLEEYDMYDFLEKEIAEYEVAIKKRAEKMWDLDAEITSYVLNAVRDGGLDTGGHSKLFMKFINLKKELTKIKGKRSIK